MPDIPIPIALHRARASGLSWPCWDDRSSGGADVAHGSSTGSFSASASNPSPYGYTVSLLIFIVPILVIGLWFVPREGVRISKAAFVRTIAILFPLGAGLDFFFARSFFKFPNPEQR